MDLTYKSSDPSPVLRTLTLRNLRAFAPSKLDAFEKRNFIEIWQNDLTFLMKELVDFTNAESTEDDPVLFAGIRYQQHPYDLSFAFRKASIEACVELDQLGKGMRIPLRERKEIHGAITRYIDETRAETKGRYSLIDIRRGEEKPLEESKPYRALRYYWKSIADMQDTNEASLMELFDTVRRESHSDIVIQGVQILSHIGMHAKFITKPESALPDHDSFLYKFAHLLAYAYSDPKNPLPYKAYNAEQRRLNHSGDGHPELALPKFDY